MSEASSHTPTIVFLNLLLNVVVVGWVLYYTIQMEHRMTYVETRVEQPKACKP